MVDAYDEDTTPRDSEYPDDAGYPDGEGTLDEGTGAYRDGSSGGGASGDGSSAVGPTGDEAADDGGRDDTGAEGEAIVEELTEFDGPDDRDE